MALSEEGGGKIVGGVSSQLSGPHLSFSGSWGDGVYSHHVVLPHSPQA